MDNMVQYNNNYYVKSLMFYKKYGKICILKEQNKKKIK